MKKRFPLIFVAAILFSSCNPFAPGFDAGVDTGASVLGDLTTVEGIFQNLKYAYTFRDTSIYGQLFNSGFTFFYRDYDQGLDVSWGRDEEMRTTSSLFQNVESLELVWNQIASISTDSTNTSASVTRNFNLTVTFNASDILRADGYATFSLQRAQPQKPWSIVRWDDQSNF